MISSFLYQYHNFKFFNDHSYRPYHSLIPHYLHNFSDFLLFLLFIFYLTFLTFCIESYQNRRVYISPFDNREFMVQGILLGTKNTDKKKK